MVHAVKGMRVAALEAGIPDAAAVVFASLGIALALHGKRAIRARVLNVGAVATSITMNLLAAARLAGAGDLGHAPDRLRLGQRHCHRCDPGVDDRPGARAARGPGRRRGHPARHPGRVPALGAAPGAGAAEHGQGFPPLGCRVLPGRPGPPAALPATTWPRCPLPRRRAARPLPSHGAAAAAPAWARPRLGRPVGAARKRYAGGGIDRAAYSPAPTSRPRHRTAARS